MFYISSISNQEAGNIAEIRGYESLSEGKLIERKIRKICLYDV